MKFLRDLFTLIFDKFECKHDWRPGVAEAIVHCLDGETRRRNQPVRYCEDCHVQEPLTVQQFYGQFGRMPW